jgi:hypothetical protein
MLEITVVIFLNYLNLCTTILRNTYVHFDCGDVISGTVAAVLETTSFVQSVPKFICQSI